MCLFRANSFGLATEQSKIDHILEPYFLLKFHGGVSWDEQYNMPVAYKHWLLNRLKQELEKPDQNQDTAVGPRTPRRNINMKQLQNMFGGVGNGSE